jgi:hypothetical protein
MDNLFEALVVGIDDYPNSPLHGCVNDANAIAKLLETNGDRSPNFKVDLKTNVSTKSQLKAMIAKLFSSNDDKVLFYFSGHGILNEIGGYMVTPDYSKYDEGISMDEILILANQSKVKDKIIILDCCHSGAMGNPAINGASSCHIAEGISILTASRDVEISIEIDGHGVFTNLLLEALRGGAADLCGNISPGGIYAFIDQALGPGGQRPVFKTNISRYTSLRKVLPLVPPDILRSLPDFFPKIDKPFQLDPSYEDTNSPTIEHKVLKPYARDENVAVFKQLQKLQSVGLIVPVNTAFMYFAAMESKACKLTPLGQHYWNLAKEKRI